LLYLTRDQGQVVWISASADALRRLADECERTGCDLRIRVEVMGRCGRRVQLGFDAPRLLAVWREELL
jgi:hypothetical protein